MATPTYRRAAIFFIATTLGVALLAGVWKFGIEEELDPFLFGTHGVDSVAERWEFVVAATLFSALAMLVPVGVAIRSINDRLHASRIADAVFRRAPQAIFVADATGGVVAVNPAFERLTGRHADGLHSNVFMGLGIVLSEEQTAALTKTMADGGEWTGEFVLERPDGGSCAVALAMTAVRDEHGQVTETIGVLTDITWRKLREDEARFEAMHDPLTGLANRRQFEEQFAFALGGAHAEGRPLALLYLDLDGFKPVNDSLGHAAGDVLLCEVARRFASVVRDSDLVARIGGDEFAIVLTALQDGAAAVTLAERCIQALASGFVLDGTPVTVGASVGIAMFPDHGQTPTDLIESADRAMYAAKAAGRNRVVRAEAPPAP